MTNVPLYQSGNVILNGSGAGTVKMGPLTAREVWDPSNVTVSANQNPTNEAQCQIYIGDSVLPQYLIDGTFSGSSGDTSDAVAGSIVKCGWYIFAVWTGGDAGQRATMTVTGTKDV